MDNERTVPYSRYVKVVNEREELKIAFDKLLEICEQLLFDQEDRTEESTRRVDPNTLSCEARVVIESSREIVARLKAEGTKPPGAKGGN
jgi:hypothetical protein